MSQLGKCVRATARQAAGRVAPGSASLGLESDFTERHILASCSREKSAFCNHRITESRMPSSSPPLGRVMRARDTGGAVLLARESQRFAQRSGHTCGTLSHLARRRRFHGDTPLGRGRRGRGHRCAWGCANTGCLTVEALEMLRDLRILGIEANHDANMLASGPYPSLHHAITASGRQRGKIAPHDDIGWRNSDRSLRML